MKTCVRLLFVVAVLLAVGCSRLGRTAEEMRQTIACADSMNKAYVPMDSLADQLQSAAGYYDRFGTANEQVRAHYLLGCVYRDRGEAPEALQHYHDATDRADTTATDCDFSLLARVHGQMAELFNLQNMYKQALKEDRLAEKLSWKANDTLAAIAFIESQCADYDESTVEGADSILCLSKRAHRLYMALGEEQKANVASAPAINIYLSRGYYDKTKELIDKFEYQSEFSDSLLGRIPSYDVFYYNKGLYFLSIRQYDSASYYFRKEMSLSVDANNRNLALGGLYYVYRDLNIKDSIVKYADKYRHSVENTVTTLVYDNLQKVESQYNYSRHQHIAQQKEVEAVQSRDRLRLLFCVLVIVIVITIYTIHAIRQKNYERLQKITRSYATDMLAYHNVRLELEVLKAENDTYSQKQQELEKELNLLRDSIAHLQEDKLAPEYWGVEDILLNSTIVARFHAKAVSGRQASDEDWRELRRIFNTYLPDFLDHINNYSTQLELIDTEICILLKLRFCPGEISALLRMKPSALGNRRKRLLQKVFKTDGSASDFDAMIRQI